MAISPLPEAVAEKSHAGVGAGPALGVIAGPSAVKKKIDNTFLIGIPFVPNLAVDVGVRPPATPCADRPLRGRAQSDCGWTLPQHGLAEGTFSRAHGVDV